MFGRGKPKADGQQPPPLAPFPSPPWLAERAEALGHPEWADHCPTYDSILLVLIDMALEHKNPNPTEDP